jgi:hypothetical protein
MKKGRRIKKLIYVEEKSKRHIVMVFPDAQRLKYHGIEPETIAAVELDIYLPVGERTGRGYPMMYSNTESGGKV